MKILKTTDVTAIYIQDNSFTGYKNVMSYFSSWWKAFMNEHFLLYLLYFPWLVDGMNIV